MQKAERLNAAHGLLARGLSVAEVAVSLSRQFTISQRQAYRYVQEAQSLGEPIQVTEPTVATTFKLAPSLVRDLRARAVIDGATISDTVTRALSAFLADTSHHG